MNGHLDSLAWKRGEKIGELRGGAHPDVEPCINQQVIQQAAVLFGHHRAAGLRARGPGVAWLLVALCGSFFQVSLYVLHRRRSDLFFFWQCWWQIWKLSKKEINTWDSLEIKDMLTLRRLLFWVKYMKQILKLSKGHLNNVEYSNTCWKLFVLLSLSSGSGIIFEKSLISHTLKMTYEAALQTVSDTWTCFGRHGALLLDQLLGFLQICHIFIVLSPQILHMSQHELHRTTHSCLLKKTKKQ